MEVKKNYKANLENFRGSFMLIGLVIAIIATTLVFGVSKSNVEISDLQGNSNNLIDQEMVVNTKRDAPKPPPIRKKYISDVFEIVKNDVILIDTFDFPGNETPVIISIDPINEIDTTEIDPPVFIADKMPEFPGGEKALYIFIKKNIEYPELAIENDIEATVYVRFVVSKNGKISNVMVANKVDPLLAEEAVRVIKKLPDFKPGVQNSRNVAVWMNVPIEFKLEK